MSHEQCEGKKYVVNSTKSPFILVHHKGNHVCASKTRIEADVITKLEEYFKMNPTSTRSEAWVHFLNREINFANGPEDIVKAVTASLNSWDIDNAKQRAIKTMNPHGATLEAIRMQKEKIEKNWKSIQNHY